jgi:F0F1-type ATP synthase membrane subunit a
MNITPENLHVYIFTIIGLLAICFITVFYMKSSSDAEIDTMKKKMKKMQNVQKMMYSQIKNISEKQQQEEQERIEAQRMKDSDENNNENQEEGRFTDEGDSYIDPLN